MFICLDTFSNNIDALIKHLHFEVSKDKFFRELVHTKNADSALFTLINSHIDNVIKPSSISSKKFTYTNAIISLYGFLESFLEKLAEEFITQINDASIPVSALPKAIRENHLELSMQLLTKNVLVKQYRTLSFESFQS